MVEEENEERKDNAYLPEKKQLKCRHDN